MWFLFFFNFLKFLKQLIASHKAYFSCFFFHSLNPLLFLSITAISRYSTFGLVIIFSSIKTLSHFPELFLHILYVLCGNLPPYLISLFKKKYLLFIAMPLVLSEIFLINNFSFLKKS